MEEVFPWIVGIAVVFGQVILPIIRWFLKQQAKQAQTQTSAPRSGAPSPTAGKTSAGDQMRILREAIEAMASGVMPATREQFEAAQRRTQGLIRQAELQVQRLGADEGSTRVIVETLEHPTLADLRSTERRLQQALDMLAQDIAAGSAFVRNNNTLGTAKDANNLGEVRIAVLTEAAIARTGRMAEVMADSDAFAGALVEPLRAFAAGHGLPLPPNEPISLPVAPGQEAMVRGLFADHPVIFVPPDFGEHIYRWAAVAHEVGHILWHAEPSLRHEMMRIAPSNERPYLPRPVDGRLIFNFDAAFAGWLEELVCDAFAVILLGPAGFRGMIHALDNPSEPLQALFAHPDPSGQLLDEHPPPHLRVHLAAWLLDHLGYDQEMKPLLAAWQKSHEDADYLIVPVAGTRQTVSADLKEFTSRGIYILDEMMSEEFRGLGGYPLSAVVGQELGPGEWAAVKRRAEQILAGESFHDAPRVAIAAGIEAAAKSPGSVQKIAAAVRSTIVGRGQRLSADSNFRGHPRGDEHQGRPVAQARDAILLWEVLNRPRAGAGRR